MDKQTGQSLSSSRTNDLTDREALSSQEQNEIVQQSQPQPDQVKPQQRPGSSGERRLTVIILSAIIIFACVVALLIRFEPEETPPGQPPRNQTTATTPPDNSAAIATSNAQATAFASTLATVTAQVQHANATSTAVAQAYATDPYGLNGSLAFYSPLTGEPGIVADGMSSSWDLDSQRGQNTCQQSDQVGLDVTNGGCTLYVNPTGTAGFQNVALQVKTTILRGQFADLNYMNYHLVFFPNGYYTFENSTTQLTSGWSSAFHPGYHQMNMLGLVKQGNTTTWYVNGVRTDSITLSQPPVGELELWAFGRNGTTEVAYRDLAIWEL